MSAPLGLSESSPTLDQLFAFGIDPVGGGLPTDIPGDWPTIAQVEEYNSNVRRRLDEALERAGDACDGGVPTLLGTYCFTCPLGQESEG